MRNEDGDKNAGFMYEDQNGAVNASNWGKDSEGGHLYRPKAGYDGHVVVDPAAQWTETDQVSGAQLNKSRKSIVFHELSENYERTEHNITSLTMEHLERMDLQYRENTIGIKDANPW